MARRLVGQSDPKWLVANLPCRLTDLPCLPTSLGSGAALLVCPFACLSFATSRRDWENWRRADDDRPWFHTSTTKRVSQSESKNASKSNSRSFESVSTGGTIGETRASKGSSAMHTIMVRVMTVAMPIQTTKVKVTAVTQKH